MKVRLITFAEVMKQTSISKSQLYRMIAAERFPKPIKIGPRRIAFLEHEVNSWFESLLKSRDQ